MAIKKTRLETSIEKAVIHLRKSDPVLQSVIKAVGPCKFKTRRNRYQSLVRSIVAQQISVAAARTILGRLRDHVDKLQPEIVAQLSVDQLRDIGISRQKAGYLLDLSQKVNTGDLKLSRLGQASNQSVIDELIQVKGIGVWTAQMFLMFSLGRLDVLPVGDLGIQNAMTKSYRIRGKITSKRMQKLAKPWHPFETIACWYLWRSLEL